MAQDITERKQAEAAIQQMAYYDILTDLPNRTLFNDRLTLELAHVRRNKQMLAMLFLAWIDSRTLMIRWVTWLETCC